jgi:hypothetical protein
MFITKLDRHFVDSKLMNALGIIHPQFWMQLHVDSFLSLHINVIKKNYCELKKVKPSFDQITKPLNANFLDLQQSMFRFKALKAAVKPFDINLITKLWVTINNNGLLT